jgi:predicted MFS family arabinose efflux permease
VTAARASGARPRNRRVAAFGHRNYRLFFAGQAISLVGSWMQVVAQDWLVLQVSGGQPFWLGVVSAAQFLPPTILGLFGGVIADALPKRQTLRATQVAFMTLAGILAVLTATGNVSVAAIVLLALLLGCTNAVDMPARQSFSVELVGPEDVGNAVALNASIFNGARVIGPAIAGLLIGAVGIAAAFAINSLSFLAAIAALQLMRDDEMHRARFLNVPRSAHEIRDNLAEGLAYVRRTPIVLMAISVVGIVATLGMNYNVLTPPLAQQVLGSDAAGYGFLMTAAGIGALAGAVSLVLAGPPRPWRIPAGALVLGIATVLLSFSRSYPLSLVLMIPIGFGGVFMAATANATIQLHSPDGLRGRVMSVYTTVFSASVPIGGIAAGTLAATLGVPVTLAISGGLSLLAGIGAAAWWLRIRGAAEQTGARAPASTAATSPVSAAAQPPQAAAPAAPADGALRGRPSSH